MSGIPFHAVAITVLAIALLGAAAAFYRWRSGKKSPLRQAPGSRIALAVSEHFTPADRFAGFIHEKSGTSIALLELPLTAFEPLQAVGRAKETFEAQGVIGVESRSLPGRSGDYSYLRGEQNTALVDYEKYILIFRDGGMTGMVSANVPRAALISGIMTGATIEKILASASVRADAPEAPKLFTLSYLGPFEEDLSLLGTTKGYRLKPSEALDSGKGLQPLFLVAPSLSVAPIPNLGLFAGRSFDHIDQMTDKTVQTVRELTISGLPAVEIAGRGTDVDTGVAALVYQLVVEARHGGYFRLIGLAPESVYDEFLSHFRRMGEGFSPS
ncbi:MAG: hypothetical protein ACLP7P_12305 [Rhodomicrobium sp.]